MNEYQDFVDQTTVCRHDREVPYLSLALCGEAGEVANKVKKAIRDNNGRIQCEDKHHLALELGDCLYFIARIASELGFPFR